jgi:hypothetical protein
MSYLESYSHVLWDILFIMIYLGTLGWKIYDIFFNTPYVVCYHLAQFGVKTPLVHEETKKINYVKG